MSLNGVQSCANELRDQKWINAQLLELLKNNNITIPDFNEKLLITKDALQEELNELTARIREHERLAPSTFVNSWPEEPTHSDKRYVDIVELAKRGMTDRMQYYLENGADPNEHDKYHEYAVLWAAQRGDLEMLKLLVQAGARLNVRSSGGVTPLGFAKYCNKDERMTSYIENELNIASEKWIRKYSDLHKEARMIKSRLDIL
jgi:ankyrin repeat protein